MTEASEPSVATSGDAAGTSARATVVVFLAVTAVLFLIQGNRFVLTNDEGILLEPAKMMAAGARPYIDFFGYMSPGSYWIQAGLFKVFGVSLLVGRLPVIFGFAIQCALVFWLTARLASRKAAWAALAVFAGFQVADPSFLTAQHRWDSATLALAGVAAVVRSQESRTWIAGSGVLLAMAAWCTPSVGLVGVVVAVWLIASRERRRLIVPFVAGVAGVSLAAVAWLAAVGSLGAFWEQMEWLQKNYAAVNVMPYGSVIGGWGSLLEGSAGMERFVRILIVGCLALPAVLPIMAVVLSGSLWWRESRGEGSGSLQGLRSLTVAAQSRGFGFAEAGLLVGATVALTLSAFPRADLTHLAFVAALPYALVAAGLARLLSVKAGAILTFSVLPFAALFAFNNFSGAMSSKTVATRAGVVRATKEVAPGLEKVVYAVGPGDTMFVYPYMPVLYFVTQSRNPTRFPFLAAGMMTHREETAALEELAARPPQWLLYMRLSREEFLRVFPHGAGLDQRFEELETWLERHYQPVGGVNVGGYELRRWTETVAEKPR